VVPAGAQLTRLFEAQAGILYADMDSQEAAAHASARDGALRAMSTKQRQDCEIICLALAAMCKQPAA
jgi:hypothetical protein